MKRYILITLLLSIAFLQGCKKDLTPTFTELQPKEINMLFSQTIPPNLNYSSNYKFKYGANGMLDSVTFKGIQNLESYNNGSGGGNPFKLRATYPQNKYELTNPSVSTSKDRYMIADERYRPLECQYLTFESLGSVGCLKVFKYSENKLTRIVEKYDYNYGNNIDSIYNIEYTSNLLTKFSQQFAYDDSTRTYTVEYQNATPDEEVINVNGMNNLFFCIPFEVQGVLPFLAVDNRFSLSGIAMHNLISGFSIAETRNGNATITRHFDVVYNYDSEDRIVKITYVNSANLANYRVIDISY